MQRTRNSESTKENNSSSKSEKRLRSIATCREKASCKHPWTQKNKSSKIVNTSESLVDWHLLDNASPADGQQPQPSSGVHINTDVGTMEYPDYIMMGNHEES